MTVFERFTEVAPEDARSWLLLGTTLEQLGERERAVAAYERGRAVAAAHGDTRNGGLIDSGLRRLNP